MELAKARMLWFLVKKVLFIFIAVASAFDVIHNQLL
jgi:hypothetical protein